MITVSDWNSENTINLITHSTQICLSAYHNLINVSYSNVEWVSEVCLYTVLHNSDEMQHAVTSNQARSFLILVDTRHFQLAMQLIQSMESLFNRPTLAVGIMQDVATRTNHQQSWWSRTCFLECEANVFQC